MPIAVRKIDRTQQPLAAEFAELGVATVHEAQGRKGLLDHCLRPIYRPVSVAGTAVTCEVAPGDNWMIHVAVELCEEGDVLVVTPTSNCQDGYFGDLLATSLQARGVKGLVINAGVRDIATLTEMQFPVWSAAVCAQGTVKETLANVNTTIVCAGQRITPGDLVVADDDGVVIVRKDEASTVLEKAKQRVANEEEKRARFESGELGLDVYDMRDRLAAKGLRYVDTED
ncbi:MAG: 4-carboxy-4-hydroxy-2-oxoadipate aldolase/oxaloacetate decarboxylase [Woeseia sp.]|nr:4-carboxy-4-hydroxy-2-oxoadipate aldolase/oxaloacetate decarboxylase [Woeseia sp.]NNE60955.1 4-carboxy-4-hydroxy-2-oxoadipate aldolase/oxaloacetate decarboxylase [Woeseia sp.]NNL53969.1 4-carboxy-4-hydroxy-2-oxoadipate aldolase/oxaloacetate decarboxylase [Woeseia sp.]